MEGISIPCDYCDETFTARMYRANINRKPIQMLNPDTRQVKTKMVNLTA